MQFAFQSHLIAIKEVFSDQRKLQNLYDVAAQKNHNAGGTLAGFAKNDIAILLMRYFQRDAENW